jgi:hypothetical protein
MSEVTLLVIWRKCYVKWEYLWRINFYLVISIGVHFRYYEPIKDKNLVFNRKFIHKNIFEKMIFNYYFNFIMTLRTVAFYYYVKVYIKTSIEKC